MLDAFAREDARSTMLGVPLRSNSRLKYWAQLPQSQKCSSLYPPGGDSRWRVKTRPSRRYRNGARQAGFEHSETIGEFSIVGPPSLQRSRLALPFLR
jgi:hypothetical protein